MNRIDLTNLGGFPLEQDTLKFMQDSYADLFEAIARLAGDKTILSGVETAGGNVTGGWITYNGEIIKFTGGAAGPGVVVTETSAPALFEDGVERPVYKTRIAYIGSPATFPFADLVRADTLAALWAKVNRPAGYIAYTGSYALGNIITDSIFTVFIPDQGTSNYIVAGSLVGQQANPDFDNDVAWIISAKTAASFKIAVREFTTVNQNLVFEFAIIKTS